MKGLLVVLLLSVLSLALAHEPLRRARQTENGELVDYDELYQKDHMVEWVKKAAEHREHGLHEVFPNGIPQDATTLEDLQEVMAPPPATAALGSMDTADNRQDEIEIVKNAFGYEVDEACLKDRKYWYRQYDGSCNWMRKGEKDIGSLGFEHSRDYDQTSFADGFNSPRQGPNPREVSNAFFQRKEKLYYDHTAVLLALIEFIMHDVSYSQDDKTDGLTIQIPKGDPHYDPHGYGNATFWVNRTKKVPGTGVPGKPRQEANMATTWIDLSALYGSKKEDTMLLRSLQGGKLKVTMKDGKEYLPWNTFGMQMNSFPGQDPTTLFAGGDPRTNEDWLLLGIHTIMLREHNRLCTMMAADYPTWDDERIFQTVRLVMSSKFMLAANGYQMAYWNDDMPWPRDDGFSLYRQMYGKGIEKYNPYHTYPWPVVTRPNGQPTIASAEMAIGYRFHELIINSFPVIDADGKIVKEQPLFATGFNAEGFFAEGLEPLLRGMANATIPNFKSGIDDSFRNAGAYRGHRFDIATWSVVHEREQGLPTFNEYFGAFMKQKPAPSKAAAVLPRKTFEEFTTDPHYLSELKRLYKTPDEVDMVAGLQLDEQYFPGTTVPRSALIVSLFSLFGLGNSDRFQPGYAITRCLLVDNPFSCHVTNALEDFLWQPDTQKIAEGFPNAKKMNTKWIAEMDFQAHGRNLLWRFITENSDVKCLQRDPLFPASKTNPVLCKIPDPSLWDNIMNYGTIIIELIVTYPVQAMLIAGVAALVIYLAVKIIKWIWHLIFPKSEIQTLTPAAIKTGLKSPTMVKNSPRTPKNKPKAA